MRTIFYLIVCVVLISCNGHDRALEIALDFAGDNRRQLEIVLQYYMNDQQKLDAAKYLIRNMPYNYELQSPIIDSAKNIISTVDHPSKLINIDDNRPFWHEGKKSLTAIYDSHIITAEYLINHIDYVFKLKSLSWNKNLTTDDFYIYLLPYRVGNEPISLWVERYGNVYKQLIEDQKNIINCANIILDHIKEGYIYTSLDELPDLDANFILTNKVGSCRESSAHILYAMRSVGIPCVIDMYLQSLTFRGGHKWNVIKHNDGSILPFWMDIDSIVYGATIDRMCGKVYRKTFSVNNYAEGFDTPVFLHKSTHSKFADVTSEYYGCNTTLIPILGEKNNIIYLGQAYNYRYRRLDRPLYTSLPSRFGSF